MSEPKIKSIDELRRIRDEAKKDNTLRLSSENPERTVLAVGMATCGIAAGARETAAALRQAIIEHDLTDVSVVATGCMGLCWAEPTVEVRAFGRPPVRYGSVDAALAREIVEKHIVNGELVGRAVITREI